jgi:acetolactate decarboxylase
MRITRYLMVILLWSLLQCGPCLCESGQKPLFQYSAYAVLAEGTYDGDLTFEELAKHGDFGLGTFNGIDGEMIGLDGKFYQVKFDGKVLPVEDSMKTPFAMVTFFSPEKQTQVRDISDIKALEGTLDGLIPTKKHFFAIRVDGTFTKIKARSVPAQTRPYPSLEKVVSGQSVFSRETADGTIVGFRCPAFANGVNAPGYHFHFLSSDRKWGGHVLECSLENAKVALQDASSVYLVLISDK